MAGVAEEEAELEGGEAAANQSKRHPRKIKRNENPSRYLVGEKEGVLVVEFSPVFRAGLGLSLWILKERASPKGRRSWGTPRGILWAC